jgi:hypothetical protein
MFAEAIVDRRTVAEATTVPGIAILERLEASGVVGSGVFKVEGDVARWVPVRVLARSGDRVAVEGDLGAGARVAVAGHVDLADGSPVRLAGPEPAPAPAAGGR